MVHFIFCIGREKPCSFYCQPSGPAFCGRPYQQPQKPPTESEAGEGKVEGEDKMEEEGAGNATEQPTGSSQEQPEQQGKGPLHPGVICDGCGSAIYGTRYKCLVCHDYDLCSSCENKGEHVDHNMISIKVPQSYSPWGFHHHGPGHGGPWRGRGGHCRGGARGHPWGHRGAGHGHPWGAGMHHRGGAHGHPFGAWMQPYFLQAFSQGGQCGPRSGPPGNCPPGCCQGQQQQQQQQQPEKPMEEQPTAGSAPTEEEGKLEQEQRQSYLQDIGAAVSSFLQPFGVKVDVGVVDEGPPKTSSDDTAATAPPAQSVSQCIKHNIMMQCNHLRALFFLTG